MVCSLLVFSALQTQNILSHTEREKPPNVRNSLGLHLLYSDTSFTRSSTEILLLSCLKSGEKRDSLSNAPWLSLKTDLRGDNWFSVSKTPRQH